MKTPEGRIKDEIRRELVRMGAYIFCPIQIGMGKRTVDILASVPQRVWHTNNKTWTNVGRFVAIEVKAPGNKPTKLQEEIMTEINKANGVSFWCDSLDSFLRTMTIKGFIGQPHQVKDER